MNKELFALTYVTAEVVIATYGSEQIKEAAVGWVA